MELSNTAMNQADAEKWLETENGRFFRMVGGCELTLSLEESS